MLPPTEPEEESAAGNASAVGAQRRPALGELQRVGPLYAILNMIAPVVRLAAIVTFLFTDSEAYRELLSAMMIVIVVGASRPLLFRIGGELATKTTGEKLPDATDASSAADADQHVASSLFHQTRLVWSQVLRCILMGSLLTTWAISTKLNSLRIGYRDLPFQPHGHGGHVFPGGVPEQFGAGGAAFALMTLLWLAAHSVSPREKLTADAPTDLSAANEDELLRGMRPKLRFASLSARCLSVAFETCSDIMLLFVFLPSSLSGVDPPSASPLRATPLLALLAALIHGSQHLRFRWEWLLCTGNGLLLAYLAIHFDGSMLAPLVAASSFALFRHWKRTGVDARRAHKQ